MRFLIVALVIALVSQVGMPNAHACGDKTMRVKTGLRYRTLEARALKNPSKILILASALPGQAEELKQYLNEVGHYATAVNDVAITKNILGTFPYDLVFTDLAQAPELQKHVDSFAPRTLVVPVLLKQPKAEAKAAGKQYRVIVNHPSDGIDFLLAVARVMDSHSHKS